MAFDLTDPIFNNEDAARGYFKSIRWPDGKPVCPHCGVVDQAILLKGKSHRAGMYQCNACREPFTVTVGSVMEFEPCPAPQMGARVPLDGGEQERRLGSPAYADARPRLVPHCMVHGASHS